jgi:small subunit ribosomal protein S8
MLILDPIGDLLTRIRNGQKARKEVVECPISKERAAVLRVLVAEGYLSGILQEKGLGGHEVFKIKLKYVDGRGAIQMVKRISTPGRRVYSSVKNLIPVNNGLGLHILSTPKGIMSELDARRLSVGGEVLCAVF